MQLIDDNHKRKCDSQHLFKVVKVSLLCSRKCLQVPLSFPVCPLESFICKPLTDHKPQIRVLLSNYCTIFNFLVWFKLLMTAEPKTRFLLNNLKWWFLSGFFLFCFLFLEHFTSGNLQSCSVFYYKPLLMLLLSRCTELFKTGASVRASFKGTLSVELKKHRLFLPITLKVSFPHPCPSSRPVRNTLSNLFINQVSHLQHNWFYEMSHGHERLFIWPWDKKRSEDCDFEEKGYLFVL